MRVFITGVTGQLGFDCAREAVKRGHEVVGSGTSWNGKTYSIKPCLSVETEKRTIPFIQLDITQKEAVKQTLENVTPDAIIHCAAWTNVDGAEAPEIQNRVFAINAGGTKNIAEGAKAVGAKMLYISTDYVFDGQGEEPWKPDNEKYTPLNVYGQSKLEGELAAKELVDKLFIVRSSWVFGINGSNFIKTMICAGKRYDSVRVVRDQVGAPTYTADLARLLIDMMETDKYGCYHATNEGGYISRYEFCCLFYKQYGIKTKVIPVTSEEYGHSIARRPLNSRLDTSKLTVAGFELLPKWQNAVGRYLKEACL